MMEDIFNDELVDAPDDIEQIIEAIPDQIQNESGESGNEENKKDENDTKEKDKEKVKRKLGPRPTLNAQRLKGPRGIGIMESFFSNIQLQGKGKEHEDIDLIIGRLEHWAHRLFPRMQFDDALRKIEDLGNKKDVANYVNRIRLGMEDNVVDDTILADNAPDSPPPPLDSFDDLMASVVIPAQPISTEITDEQRERMLQNRLLAEERRNARIKRAQELKKHFLASQVHKETEGSGPEEITVENKRNEQEMEVVIDLTSERTAITTNCDNINGIQESENNHFEIDGNNPIITL